MKTTDYTSGIYSDDARPVWITPSEERALRAYAIEGDYKSAAKRCGVKPQTLKNQMFAAYQRLGIQGHVDAFRVLGWLDPKARTLVPVINGRYEKVA